MAFYRGSLLETFILPKTSVWFFLTLYHFFRDSGVSAGFSRGVQSRLWSQGGRKHERQQKGSGTKRGITANAKYCWYLYIFLQILLIMLVIVTVNYWFPRLGQVPLLNDVSSDQESHFPVHMQVTYIHTYSIYYSWWSSRGSRDRSHVSSDTCDHLRVRGFAGRTYSGKTYSNTCWGSHSSLFHTLLLTNVVKWQGLPSLPSFPPSLEIK